MTKKQVLMEGSLRAIRLAERWRAARGNMEEASYWVRMHVQRREQARALAKQAKESKP